MTKPKKTVWPLDEHSRGKHLVLEHYLNQWLPKLMRTHSRVLFMDGFAGPGVYEGGELGSPLIVLKVHREHVDRPNWRGTLICYFLDSDSDRITVLNAEVKKLPYFPNVEVRTNTIVFHAAVIGLRATLDQNKTRLIPAFVMVDPFGVAGVHMEDMQWVLAQPSGEVYATIMADHIARFCGTDEFVDHLNALYGSDCWRPAREETDHVRRREVFVHLLRTELKRHAKHVVSFDLYDGNVFKYTIVHATNRVEGCDAMKQAIWRTMPGGTYTFRGDYGQLAFDVTDFAAFADEIARRDNASDWIGIDELVEWAGTDATRFHSGHVKRALKILEKDGRLEVRGERRRAGEYPDGRVELRVIDSMAATPVRPPPTGS